MKKDHGLIKNVRVTYAHVKLKCYSEMVSVKTVPIIREVKDHIVMIVGLIHVLSVKKYSLTVPVNFVLNGRNLRVILEKNVALILAARDNP